MKLLRHKFNEGDEVYFGDRGFSPSTVGIEGKGVVIEVRWLFWWHRFIPRFSEGVSVKMNDPSGDEVVFWADSGQLTKTESHWSDGLEGKLLKIFGEDVKAFNGHTHDLCPYFRGSAIADAVLAIKKIRQGVEVTPGSFDE